MPDINSPVAEGDADRHNDIIRGYFFCMNPGQISRLAEFFGVSYREVERWFTLSDQRRRCLLKAFEGKVPVDLGEMFGGRCFMGYALGNDMTQQSKFTGKLAQYHVNTSSLAQAMDYINGMVFGGIDPFLEVAWERITLDCTNLVAGWRITVYYRRQHADDPDS